MNFKLSSLAALGLVTGAMAQADAKCTSPSSSETATLFSQIDSSHQKMYNSMDCEGKKLAMQLAQQTCAGKNSCAGLNACKTPSNSCAGQGGCQGMSPGPFTDKNKAVEVAQRHMAQKRSNTMGG